MINKTQLQNEFETMCFMHEVDTSNELRECVKKFNSDKPLTKFQKNLLVKSIWRI